MISSYFIKCLILSCIILFCSQVNPCYSYDKYSGDNFIEFETLSIDDLCLLMTHGNNEIAEKVAIELGDRRCKMAADILIYAIWNRKGNVKEASVKALSKIDADEYYYQFISLISDKDWHIRREAVLALGKSRIVNASRHLARCLCDKEWMVKAAAVDSLSSKGINACVEIINNYSQFDSRSKEYAVMTLNLIDLDISSRMLSQIYYNEGDGIELRALAVEGLVGRKGEEIYKLFIYASYDKCASIRTSAAKGLGKISEEKCIMPLLRMLSDDNCQVRGAAYNSLVIFKEKAIPFLINALDGNENETIKQYISITLSTITGKDFGSEYRKWKEWFEERKHRHDYKIKNEH